jgi:hypothetical protein
MIHKENNQFYFGKGVEILKFHTFGRYMYNVARFFSPLQFDCVETLWWNGYKFHTTERGQNNQIPKFELSWFKSSFNAFFAI